MTAAEYDAGWDVVGMQFESDPEELESASDIAVLAVDLSQGRKGEPVRILGVSTKRVPDVVAYPEQGYAWVATRHPERPVPEGGDPGIIARFDMPGGE
jgi:hypothetical protein